MNDLLALLDYTAWATARLLAALAPLTLEERARDLHSSHGGIAGTLAHLYGADVIWTARLRSEPAPAFADIEIPAGLQGSWLALQVERRSFVATLDSGQTMAYTNLTGEAQTSTVGEIVRHIVNHATHHRGQIVTMLRQLGYAAPNTDLIAFYRRQAK
jgi:uncharacterized damage-inducible protein DinB